MPGKHVHFAVSNVPSTPSSTYSTSSLPSSGPPSTPPPVMGFGSPYQYSPLPGSYAVNPALGVREILPYDYDVSYPPSSIKPRVPISPTIWDEPATKPGMPAITIISSSLPWRMTITAAKGGNVTVRDVIDGLHRALRTNVTPVEFSLLPSPDAQHRVNAAYKRRYKRMPDLVSYEQEKAGGLKRVDFLGERTMFMGLACTEEGGHVWKLVVS